MSDCALETELSSFAPGVTWNAQWSSEDVTPKWTGLGPALSGDVEAMKMLSSPTTHPEEIPFPSRSQPSKVSDMMDDSKSASGYKSTSPSLSPNIAPRRSRRGGSSSNLAVSKISTKRHRKATSTSSATSPSSSGDSSRNKRQHNLIEQKYRTRLNKQFDTLLQAIPREVTRIGDREEPEKKISKGDVLMFAKKYIEELERKQGILEGKSKCLTSEMNDLRGAWAASGLEIPGE